MLRIDPSDLDDDRAHTRAQWGHKMEFILTCVGYSVGLGNVWRFPYLAYKNGGAAFVVAYMFLQITIGKPLYLMEMAMGQYSAKGPVRVWSMFPLARGIGFSMCFVSIIIAVYYNVIMAYVLHYFFASLQTSAPWSECKPKWKNCITDRKKMTGITFCETGSKPESNCTCSGDENIDLALGFQCVPKLRTPSEIYFYDEVIAVGRSLSPEDFGAPSPYLSVTLFFAWVLVIACVINGVKSTGKVVYFTATFPYVVLTILLVRGVTLDGASVGIEYFIVPEWSQLSRTQLWLDAMGQMFFSLGLTMGGIISASSYSPFSNNIYGDSLFISSMDVFTSLLAGFVIFTTFGHISETSGVDIDHVVRSGYGLAFVAYPEALMRLPAPQMFSALFFLMLLTLGLDSEFALFETFITYLQDDFKKLRAFKTQLRLGLGMLCFLAGLAFVTPAGIHLTTVFDTYGASYTLVSLCGVEVVSVMWGYGINTFLDDCEYMLGKKPTFLPFWYFSLGIWAPLVMNSMAVISLVKSETPKYFTGHEFSSTVMLMCWLLYCFIMAPVPLWFLLYTSAMYRRHGFTSLIEFLRILGKPDHRWGPADATHPAATRRLDSIWTDVCPGLCGLPVIVNMDDEVAKELKRRTSSHVSFSGNVKETKPKARKKSPPPKKMSSAVDADSEDDAISESGTAGTVSTAFASIAIVGTGATQD